MKLSQKISMGFAALFGILTVWLHIDDPSRLQLTDLLIDFVYLLTGNVTPEQVPWAGLAYLTVVAIPCALCCGLLWFSLSHRKAALPVALAAAAVLFLITLIVPHIALLSVYTDPLYTIIPTLLGGFGCIGCIWLYGILQKACPKIFNRETVSYIVFGVLTTVISFVSQMLFASLGTPAAVNTIGSWICSVTFAYIVNKLFVFESRTDSKKAFWRELWLFFAARLASLGMELVFMFITVDLLHFSEAVCKLIAQVFILVANYVFSKLIIFRTPPKAE